MVGCNGGVHVASRATRPELKLKTAFFVSWIILTVGVLFVVPIASAWPVIAALVSLLWLLAQLAKRLARS